MNTATLNPAQRAVLLQVAHEYCEQLHQNLPAQPYAEMSEAEQRTQMRDAVRELMTENRFKVDEAHTEELTQMIEDEFFGLGALENEVIDPRITDILINGTNNVYIERGGNLERLRFRFQNEKQLLHMAQRMAGRLGLPLDARHAMLDGVFPDGSRVNMIVAPLARKGPNISIRRFPLLLTMDKLIENGTLTREMVEFLKACVEARLNMMIAGGSGAGKTTLLNVLSRFIPEGQRIVTIEDAAELQLQQEHVVPLEVRETGKRVTQRDLLRNALRMRPDRIIIGECRGPEAFDMLQAMNTGHEGSLTTIHANSPRDAIIRLQSMVEMAGLNISASTITREVASAIQVVLHVGRLQGGLRKVTRISQIAGMEQDVLCMDDLFVWETTGVGTDGKVRGRFHVTGNFPTFYHRFEEAGVALPADLFSKT